MYSLVSLLSRIYPLLAMHSLLVTLYITEYLIGIKVNSGNPVTFRSSKKLGEFASNQEVF